MCTFYVWAFKWVKGAVLGTGGCVGSSRLIFSPSSSPLVFPMWVWERKWVPSPLCRRKWSVAAAGFPPRGAPTNGTVMEHCCESSRIHALTCTSTNLHTPNKKGRKKIPKQPSYPDPPISQLQWEEGRVEGGSKDRSTNQQHPQSPFTDPFTDAQWIQDSAFIISLK